VLEDFTPYSYNSLDIPVEERIFTEYKADPEENVIRNFYHYIEEVLREESALL